MKIINKHRQDKNHGNQVPRASSSLIKIQLRKIKYQKRACQCKHIEKNKQAKP